MSEKVWKVIRLVIEVVLFVFLVGLVIWGHGEVGWARLGVMGIGLIGLLVMLYLYNRSHR
jgi:hypothetical protein